MCLIMLRSVVDPGQPGSLGNASAIVIDTAAPDDGLRYKLQFG